MRIGGSNDSVTIATIPMGSSSSSSTPPECISSAAHASHTELKFGELTWSGVDAASEIGEFVGPDVVLVLGEASALPAIARSNEAQVDGTCPFR